MAKSARKKDPIPALEWIAAAIGLGVALVLLGILGREAITGQGRDVPVLAVQIEEIEATPSGHIARILVSNRSGQTAAAVQVEGKLGDETSSATLDYVPGHSVARGGLVFSSDPAGRVPSLRVTGYQQP